MNWEKSSAATPLKCAFLNAFFDKEKRFFLTGGSALGLFYLQHRFSYDLDLFSTEPFDWTEVDGVIRLCAREMGVEIALLRTSPTFRRYSLTNGSDSEIIDIVYDMTTQIDVDKTWVEHIQVDTLHEIMLNKITTLVSRCEIKDIIDLYYMEQEGLVIEDCFADAQSKDGGLDPAVVSMLLVTIQISDLPDYLIKPLTVAELRAYVQELKIRMAVLAYPEPE